MSKKVFGKPKQVQGGPGKIPKKFATVPELPAYEYMTAKDPCVLLSTTTSLMARGYPFVVRVYTDGLLPGSDKDGVLTRIVCAPSRELVWPTLWQYNVIRQAVDYMLKNDLAVIIRSDEEASYRDSYQVLSPRQLGTLSKSPMEGLAIDKKVFQVESASNACIALQHRRIPLSGFADAWRRQDESLVPSPPLKAADIFELSDSGTVNGNTPVNYRNIRGTEFGLSKGQFVWINHPNLPRTLAKAMFITASSHRLQDIRIFCLMIGASDNHDLTDTQPSITGAAVCPKYLQPLAPEWVKWFAAFNGNAEQLYENLGKLDNDMTPSTEGCTGVFSLSEPQKSTKKPLGRRRRTYIELD